MMGLDFSTVLHIQGLYGALLLYSSNYSFIPVVVVPVCHPIIFVGGVYMIRSVPHPMISVEYQLIGSMLVVLVYISDVLIIILFLD